MARTRRRPYPAKGTMLDDPKYGMRGNAHGHSHTGSKGQSDKGGKPRPAWRPK